MNKTLLLSIRRNIFVSFFLLLFTHFGFSQEPIYKHRIDVQAYQQTSNIFLDHIIARDIPKSSFANIGLSYEKWLKRRFYLIQGLNFLYRQVPCDEFTVTCPDNTTEDYYQAAIFIGLKLKKNKSGKRFFQSYTELDVIYEFNYGTKESLNFWFPEAGNIYYEQQTHTLAAQLKYGFDIPIGNNIYFNAHTSLLLGASADKGSRTTANIASTDDFHTSLIRSALRLGFHAGIAVGW